MLEEMATGVLGLAGTAAAGAANGAADRPEERTSMYGCVGGLRAFAKAGKEAAEVSSAAASTLAEQCVVLPALFASARRCIRAMLHWSRIFSMMLIRPSWRWCTCCFLVCFPRSPCSPSLACSDPL